MQRIAVELKLDPLDVIRRNLVPSGAFPYRTATGGAARLRRLSGLRRDRRSTTAASPNCARAQTTARAEGRLYGIGLTAVVEPSVSNMGYITTVLTPEERRKAGPKNGAQATATIALDPGRRGVGACRVGAAGPGPSHRGVADRRRCARAEAVRHPRRHRHRHRARRLVDRVGQLCQPLRAGGRRRRAACGERLEGKARARRRGAAQRAGGRDRVRGRPRARAAAIPTTRCRSARLAAASALVARHAAPRTIRRCARPCSGRRRN